MNTNPNDMRAHVMKIQNSENKKKSLNISRKEKKKSASIWIFRNQNGIRLAKINIDNPGDNVGTLWEVLGKMSSSLEFYAQLIK